MFVSRYYKTDNMSPDRIALLERLESLTRDQLVMLCDDPEIKLVFSAKDWRENTDEEDLISALFTDYNPETLNRAIDRLRSGAK